MEKRIKAMSLKNNSNGSESSLSTSTGFGFGWDTLQTLQTQIATLNAGMDNTSGFFLAPSRLDTSLALPSTITVPARILNSTDVKGLAPTVVKT